MPTRDLINSLNEAAIDTLDRGCQQPSLFFPIMFKKRTPSQQLLKKYGAQMCGPQIGIVDHICQQLSASSDNEVALFPPSLNDLEHRYPDCDAGFSAAFDSQLMSGRMDVVTNAQDLVGALAEQRYERSFLPPIGPPYGIAIGSLQAVTAFLAFDLIGREFSDQDRLRWTYKGVYEPKTVQFTAEDFERAIEPWVDVFGRP